MWMLCLVSKTGAAFAVEVVVDVDAVAAVPCDVDDVFPIVVCGDPDPAAATLLVLAAVVAVVCDGPPPAAPAV